MMNSFNKFIDNQKKLGNDIINNINNSINNIPQNIDNLLDNEYLANILSKEIKYFVDDQPCYYSIKIVEIKLVLIGFKINQIPSMILDKLKNPTSRLLDYLQFLSDPDLKSLKWSYNDYIAFALTGKIPSERKKITRRYETVIFQYSFKKNSPECDKTILPNNKNTINGQKKKPKKDRFDKCNGFRIAVMGRGEVVPLEVIYPSPSEYGTALNLSSLKISPTLRPDNKDIDQVKFIMQQKEPAFFNEWYSNSYYRIVNSKIDIYYIDLASKFTTGYYVPNESFLTVPKNLTDGHKVREVAPGILWATDTGRSGDQVVRLWPKENAEGPFIYLNELWSNSGVIKEYFFVPGYEYQVHEMIDAPYIYKFFNPSGFDNPNNDIIILKGDMVALKNLIPRYEKLGYDLWYLNCPIEVDDPFVKPVPDKECDCMSCDDTTNKINHKKITELKVELDELKQLLLKLVKNVGNFPIEINIVDSDLNEPGNQSKKIKLESISNYIEESFNSNNDIAKILGVSRFPAKLPTRLIKPIDNKDQETIHDLPEYLGYLVKQIDKAIGKLPQKIKIADADLAKPGNQSFEVEIHSLSDFARETLKILLDTQPESDIHTNMLIRCLYELGFIHQGAIQILSNVDAMVEHMDFKHKFIAKEYPFAFNPYCNNNSMARGFNQKKDDKELKEPAKLPDISNNEDELEKMLSKFLQQTWVKIRTIENIEKKSLNADIQAIKRDANTAALAVSVKGSTKVVDELIDNEIIKLQTEDVIRQISIKKSLGSGDLRTRRKPKKEK